VGTAAEVKGGRRGLSVYLDIADSDAVRQIALDTQTPQKDVLQVLELGCVQAIRSGALMRSIVARKVQQLQGLVAPKPAAPAAEEQSLPPTFEPPPENRPPSIFAPPPALYGGPVPEEAPEPAAAETVEPPPPPAPPKRRKY
jgi:hypothetical protein